MAWNYRGYGKTKGTPDPYNIKTDGESMINFILNELMIQGRIGVYGRSLGGVVATHLAATYPKHIHFLLADRTFGNLKNISVRKFVGSGTTLLYKLISFKWETYNDKNFFNVTLIKINIRPNVSRLQPVIPKMMLLMNFQVCHQLLQSKLYF